MRCLSSKPSSIVRGEAGLWNALRKPGRRYIPNDHAARASGGIDSEELHRDGRRTGYIQAWIDFKGSYTASS